MTEHVVAPDSVVFVGDGDSMGPLEPWFVRTSPLRGLDESAARAILRLFTDPP